jgi:hypothetical protein
MNSHIELNEAAMNLSKHPFSRNRQANIAIRNGVSSLLMVAGLLFAFCPGTLGIVFASLVPIVGILLSVPSFVFGIRGTMYANTKPHRPGNVSSIIAVILGTIMTVFWTFVIAAVAIHVEFLNIN